MAHCTRPLSCCNHIDAREVTQGVPTTFTVLSRAKSIRLIGEVEKSGSYSVNSFVLRRLPFRCVHIPQHNLEC